MVKNCDLRYADLVIDEIYEGGTLHKNLKDEVLSSLLGMDNSGGIRKRGMIDPFNVYYSTLYTTMAVDDWPDEINYNTGVFTYYGDNRKAGRRLHDTPKKGNLLLEEVFNLLHLGKREPIPPFFIFEKGKKGRDIIFRGLAVPGNDRLAEHEDLVAIWKTKGTNRFQNYKAIFTILDVSVVPRLWINDLLKGNRHSRYCPPAYKKWVETGVYDALIANDVIQYRKKAEQLPKTKADEEILDTIVSYFSSSPVEFEKCAIEIAQIMDSRIVKCDLTRSTRDGGVDAIGEYKIGHRNESISVEFYIEAKCYNSKSTSVGVKETSRLISRVKNRQFGILVTTSYVSQQAYKELKEDKHPIIIVSGIDIVSILRSIGVDNKRKCLNWLLANFHI